MSNIPYTRTRIYACPREGVFFDSWGFKCQKGYWRKINIGIYLTFVKWCCIFAEKRDEYNSMGFRLGAARGFHNTGVRDDTREERYGGL